jgi:hypothetical protein
MEFEYNFIEITDQKLLDKVRQVEGVTCINSLLDDVPEGYYILCKLTIELDDENYDMMRDNLKEFKAPNLVLEEDTKVFLMHRLSCPVIVDGEVVQ